MNTEELKQHLESQLADCEIKVESDGSHFIVYATGEVFAGLSTLKKQQLVYACLNEQIASGEIHALTIRASAPSE